MTPKSCLRFVVEVMLTTVVEVGMPAPSTAFEALADKAGERAREKLRSRT
jgi:hypothetical protein